MPANNDPQRYLSRRQAIALTGAAGVGSLAGCLGGDGDDGVPDALEDGTGEVDAEFPEDYEETMNQAVPGGSANPFGAEYIFNPFHTQWNAGDVQELSFEYLAVYHTGEGEFVPRVADDWEVNRDTGITRVELSEEYGWSDGSDVTAQDFVTTMKLNSYMGLGLQDYVDIENGIRTDGEYAFEIELIDELQDLEQELWMNAWAETLLHVNHEQYGGFVERFDEAETDEEIEAVQRDVISYEPEWNEVLYSGPLMFVEANEQYADQVPNQNHPAAAEWDFYLRHGEYEEEPGLRAEEVTWRHNDPTLQDLPERYDEPPVSFSGQSFAILFGTEDEYIRDYPEVRKAISYAVDFENIVNVTAPGTPVDTLSAGIDFGYAEHFIHDDVMDAMANYAPRDTDRATDLLEDAGFTQEDGNWLTPDGNEWELNFPVGDWFADHSEIIANNLNEFGITVDHYIDEMPTWQSEVEADNAYDLTVQLNYGMARDYHAYSDLDEELNNPDRGILTERPLFDAVVEVPEIGNPDGDTVEIDLEEELSGIQTAANDEELLESSTALAWAHNQLLPGAMIFPWSEHYWVDAGGYDFDIESDDWLTSNRIAHYLIENGLQPE